MELLLEQYNEDSCYACCFCIYVAFVKNELVGHYYFISLG